MLSNPQDRQSLQERDQDSTSRFEDCVAEIVQASRILACESILDSFGHVSARHPDCPSRYLMPRVRAAELVTAEDVLEFDLDDGLVSQTSSRIFAERSIHGAIYRARPDAMAVCHHHAPSLMPFCTSDAKLVPVFHLGATMGQVVPLWDSQDEFGDTNLIVSTPEQGDSLARTLSSNWTVLLRGHGAAVVGRSVRELVFRSIYGARNAEVQWRAAQIGTVHALTANEAEAAGNFNLTPFAMDRAWEQWSRNAKF
jgi:HCOMODA/2-hydroxy-3-carboxy-muconic semialdehyde decarboxylase